MKKIIASLLLLATIVVSFTCSGSAYAKTSKKSQGKMTVSKVLSRVKEANHDVTSMSIKNDITIKKIVNSEKQVTTQTIDGAMFYNGKVIVKGDATLINNPNQSDETYEEYVFSADNIMYSRKSREGSWSVQRVNPNSYYIHPDYFSLLDVVSSINDSDFKLKETSNSYQLSLKNRNLDLIGLFKEDYDLSLTGVSQKEVDKTLTITFDKDTFYLKQLKLGIIYDGKKGYLNMGVSTKYSKWNQMKDSDLTSPENVTQN